MNRFLFFLLFLSISLLTACTSSIDKSDATPKKEIKRYGMVIKIKPDKLAYYKELHANTWPGVLKQITKSNIQNYSIYYKDNYLFSYFEYTGSDFKADMEKMAKDSTTQAWWKITDTLQEPLETRADGEWWATMEEVFHHD
jgi:L-rhamnose mutarotase